MSRRPFRLRSLVASRSLRVLALMACLLITLTPSYSFGMRGMAHADASMSGSMTGMSSPAGTMHRHAGAATHRQRLASCCANHHSATCHCDAICAVAMVPGMQRLDVPRFLASLDAPLLDMRAPSALTAPPLRPPAA